MTGDELYECDVCLRLVARDQLYRVLAPGGVETLACDECVEGPKAPEGKAYAE
jgi:hypothetical protein